MLKADRVAWLVPLKNMPLVIGVARVFQRHGVWVLIVFAVLFAVGEVLLVRFFPFSQKNVTESLQETFPSKLKIERFENVYFPKPGCKAENVTFHSLSGAPGSPALVTIQKLTIQGSYADLLFRPRHISRVILDGLHIQLPPVGKAGDFMGGYTAPQKTIGEVVSNGAVIEIARANGNTPLRFDIHELSLGSVSAKEGMFYKVTMRNPEPPGEVSSTGHFGPFNGSNPGQTLASGTYSFRRADLGVFDGIAGIVSADGKFSGPLDHVDVQGTTDVPDFEIVHSGHAGHLVTRFQGFLNGTNGDVTLRSVDATYQKTRITADGDISGTNGIAGKVTSLDFAVRDGRVQDLLRLYVQKDPPPMSGVTSLQAHVTIRPEGKPFLKEVTLQGNFEIGDGHFNASSRQADVNKLSETARGLKKKQQNEDESNPLDNVIAHVRGHVEVRDGVAEFTNLLFTVPGADARMHGNYNLVSEKIDLHGTLKMDAKFSQSTSGIKTIFARVLDPFFNKKHGSEVPVLVDGTYHQPHFGIDLNPIKK